MIFVLNNIRSAWNVGSAFRTIDCLGGKLILVGYTARPVGKNQKLIAKTAIGAENFVPWEEFELSSQVFEKYSSSVHLAAEITENSENIFDFISGQTNNKINDKNSEILGKIKQKSTEKQDPNSKHFDDEVLIWFGNEIQGVEPEVLARCHKILHLPMSGKKESLNVASSMSAFGYLLKYAIES